MIVIVEMMYSFVPSCHREHALLGDTDGDTIPVLLFTSPLIVSGFQITQGVDTVLSILGTTMHVKLQVLALYNYSFSMVLLSHFSMYGMYLSSRRA